MGAPPRQTTTGSAPPRTDEPNPDSPAFGVAPLEQPMELPRIIRTGLSRQFTNKPTGPYDASAHKTFPTAEISPEELARHITAGNAFAVACYRDGHRKKANFQTAQIAAIDLDHGPDVETLAADPFIAAYAYLVYPTPSSTADRPKTRAVFVLSEPVDSCARWETLQRAIIHHCSHLQPDEAASDGARQFYGSDKPGARIIGNVLPLSIAGELTRPEAEDDQRRAAELAARPPARPFTGPEDERRFAAYAQAAIDRIISDVAAAPDGQRHDLIVHAWHAFAFADWPGVDLQRITADLLAIAERSNHPAGRRADVESARRYGLAHRRPVELPDDPPPARWPASTNGTPSARRHAATSGTPSSPNRTPTARQDAACAVDELERETAYVLAILGAPTAKPAPAPIVAPVETPWILTPYDVAGLRRFLRCNADTADIARDLLEAAAAGRLPEAFTVYQAANAIGMDEQTTRRILTRVDEYFSVSARRNSLRTQTEKNSPGQPAKLYTLPAREHVETVIAPYVDAALVQAYCPTVAPMTHDRARRMYEDDAPAEQLDELAARLTAAQPNDPTAERSARRRLQAARKMAAEIAIPLTVATAANPADRQQERDSLALELANEQPIGVRGAAAVLGCSVGKVHRRAAVVGYVYHPEENWIDVTGPGAWQDAKKAARELGGVLKEVERSASRRKVGVHKHDLQLAPGQTARVLIVSKGRFLHNPTAARTRLQELDQKPAPAAVAAPVEQPAEPTPRADRRANRYGWTYRTRLQNLEARIPLTGADGCERTPFLTVAEAIAAMLAAPVETLTAKRTARGRRSKAEIAYDGPIIGAPASCQEPPTADELPLLEAPPAEHDYGTPYVEDAAPISTTEPAICEPEPAALTAAERARAKLLAPRDLPPLQPGEAAEIARQIGATTYARHRPAPALFAVS